MGRPIQIAGFVTGAPTSSVDDRHRVAGKKCFVVLKVLSLIVCGSVILRMPLTRGHYKFVRVLGIRRGAVAFCTESRHGSASVVCARTCALKHSCKQAARSCQMERPAL